MVHKFLMRDPHNFAMTLDSSVFRSLETEIVPVSLMNWLKTHYHLIPIRYHHRQRTLKLSSKPYDHLLMFALHTNKRHRPCWMRVISSRWRSRSAGSGFLKRFVVVCCRIRCHKVVTFHRRQWISRVLP